MMQTNTKNSSRKGLDFGLVGLAIAFVGLLVLLIVFLVRKYRERKKTVSNPQQTDINEWIHPDKQTQKAVFDEIKQAALSLGFGDNAALAIAGQSCHETGRWTSELATKYFNIFGMKNGGGGQNIQTGEASGYAVYPNWDSSLSDYKAWCDAKGYPYNENLTVEQHLQWLKSKKYYEDTLENYRKSVLSLIKELS